MRNGRHLCQARFGECELGKTRMPIQNRRRLSLVVNSNTRVFAASSPDYLMKADKLLVFDVLIDNYYSLINFPLIAFRSLYIAARNNSGNRTV